MMQSIIHVNIFRQKKHKQFRNLRFSIKYIHNFSLELVTHLLRVQLKNWVKVS